jgi:hypothetical protein
MRSAPYRAGSHTRSGSGVRISCVVTNSTTGWLGSAVAITDVSAGRHEARARHDVPRARSIEAAGGFIIEQAIWPVSP